MILGIDRLREGRTQEPTLVSLPDAPGILAAMALSPALETHLQGIAQTLLVDDFPGSTLSRTERELIATAVSAGNDCCFCADSHAAFARKVETLEKKKHVADYYLKHLRIGVEDGWPGRLWSLLRIAERVRARPLSLEQRYIDEARRQGASDGDIQAAVLIAAAFCMYNRMVDGLRAKTPADAAAYEASACRIAEHGYTRVA